MKKVIFSLLFIVASLSAGLTEHEKNLSGRLVEVLGYPCKKVDNASRSLWDGSITVYCNDYSNKYVVKKLGGRWTIEVLK